MSYHPVIPENLHLVAHPATRPIHEHDCSHCIFLGQYNGEYGPADLYVHTSGHPTVLSRFSSKGPDYSSGLCFSYGTTRDLTEARKRAQKLGLLKYDYLEAMNHAKPNTPEYAELKDALLASPEYAAFLAHEKGGPESAKVHLTALFEAEKAYGEKHGHSAGYCLMQLDARLSKVVGAVRDLDWRGQYEATLGMTDFLWDALPQESEAPDA